MDYLSLCLICKDENDYLAEWLDYHILAGVDRFYIYDNDSRVSLRQTLSDYMDKGWVVVVDIPGKAMQVYAYDHCLRQFGAQTRWLGFIDTDEFLVPKATDDLKELLKGYEEYGGVAVSSLFFGSGGHKTRPAHGQLASYLFRTHPTYSENTLIKSIVQPERVLRPASPHDFIYKENFQCVNEQFLRVDNQKFPNYIEKIQLNHYSCRSESEIEEKLARGRGDAGSAWARVRFDAVNSRATFLDRAALELTERLIGPAGQAPANAAAAKGRGNFLGWMAGAARARSVRGLQLPALTEVICRPELTAQFEMGEELGRAKVSGDDRELIRLTLNMLQIIPTQVSLYTDLTLIYLRIKDAPAAWQALARAWQLAPNSYLTLKVMVFYFLRIENFEMAEKACRLMLAIAPHDLTALAFMAETLLGQGRFEEGIKIGVPVVELTAIVGELPEHMGVFLVKKMADYLLQKKDYAGAARLWEAGIKCQPGDVSLLLEWSRALLLNGEKAGARQVLLQALALSPDNPEAQRLLRQALVPAAGKGKKNRR